MLMQKYTTAFQKKQLNSVPPKKNLVSDKVVGPTCLTPFYVSFFCFSNSSNSFNRMVWFS